MGWMNQGCTLALAALALAGCGEKPPERTADAAPAPEAPTAAPLPAAVAAAPAAAPATASVTVPAVNPAPSPIPVPAAVPAVVYRWDPATFAAPAGGPFNVAAVPGADSRKRITTTSDGWNVFIFVPVGVLQGAHDYTATLSYEVVAPPPFPGTFHMFARSKRLGMERDAWCNWLGDAGERGTARLPMRLPPADDWTFSVGCKGAGSLIVDSCVISEGTGFTYVPATADAAPAAATPVADSAALPSGCASVTIDPPLPGAGLELTAGEFGLVAAAADGTTPPEVAVANAQGLAKAFAACRARSASRLVIAPGTYHLAPDPKNPLKLEGVHDLTIDGKGAMLVLSRLTPSSPAFTITGCQRLAVRDLRVDWDWSVSPIASLGVVRSVSADRLSLTMAFPDLDAAATERLKTATWSSFTPVDPVTMRTASEVQLKPKVTRRESVGPNVLDVGLEYGLPLVVGQLYLVRHLYYEMGCFKLNDCSHVLFERVTIHSMPGMGWIARGDLDHFALKDCAIARPPGSRRPMTTSADGFHILESQGGILIDGCEFTGTGDDCINIHDNCCQGVRKTGPSTLVLVANPRWRMKVAAGDRLELFHADYAPAGHTGTVQKVTYTGKGGMDAEVEFAEPLPAVVSPLSIVFNHRYGTHDVRIVHSRFDRGRVLVSARAVTIEDCTFDHPFSNAVQLHTEIVSTLWAEGSGASDVVIRGNTFAGANLRGKFGGAVVYGAPVLPAGRTRFPLFHDILIEGNTFSDSRGPVVALGACRDVTVRGNRIEAGTLMPGANAQAGCVLVECSSAVRLEGNTWRAGAGQLRPGVLFDPATTSGVQVGGNRLAEK